MRSHLLGMLEPAAILLLAEPRPGGWLLPVELQQHSWPAPSVLWKLFEYGHTFLCLGLATGCV